MSDRVSGQPSDHQIVGLRDFSKARYTAIISDLHLCEAEPPHPRFPLWKKYKTREFFFDHMFKRFLNEIVERANGEEVELVLNGDIFDFDSVMSLPENASFRIDWLEKKRGLYPEEEKSVFKMDKILNDHSEWAEALSWFIQGGHRVVFVVGNHDLELHWQAVQAKLIEKLHLTENQKTQVRFCEWFYISNGDTLIEHGNQQDPYCVCIDPLHPYVLQYNKVEVRLPFGNVVCRYMVNGMAFFNPHVDTNYSLSLLQYVSFFIRYMARAQPLLIWTWFWGSFMTLVKSFSDTLLPALRDPSRTEDKIEAIAAKSNATPRMVRELRELFANPAERKPVAMARELWLDRAFLILIGLLVLLQLFLFVKQVYDLSFFWLFVPILLLVPFFLFYSNSIRSAVPHYKEPQADVLARSGSITKVGRIVYGHTHLLRHEIIGPIEHLNPGSWSPAFKDVECTQPYGQKSFIWIRPAEQESREAHIFHLEGETFQQKVALDGARRKSLA